MLLDLQLFELKCADMPDFEIVGKFTDPDQAIAYAAGHVVDFALLDIDMPGMNGMELAQRLRQIRRDIIIVFATAHPKFAVDALRMKADYMIFKPFDREDIADVMERAKLLRRRQSKRFFFRTFGSFDMLVDGEPVRFRSAKAKELMALCLYRQGCPVSIHEIVECLWGEEAAGADSTGYRRTIKESDGHAPGLRRGGADPPGQGERSAAAGAGGLRLPALSGGERGRHLPFPGGFSAPVLLGGAHDLHLAGEKATDARPPVPAG